MKKTFLIMLLATSHAVTGQTHLDAYTKTALGNNETIKQQQFLLAKSLYALKEAKSLFLPSAALNVSYTIADGGRKIDFPAGDLLNPVYKTLNQMTGTGNFPQVQNQHVLLNPDNFYDAKIRTTYPILNAEIEYNRKIKNSNIVCKKLKRTSIKENW